MAITPTLSRRVQVGDIIKYYASPQWQQMLERELKHPEPFRVEYATQAKEELTDLEQVVVATFSSALDESCEVRGDIIDLWCVIAKPLDDNGEYVRFYQSQFSHQKDICGFHYASDILVTGTMSIQYTKEDD